MKIPECVKCGRPAGFPYLKQPCYASMRDVCLNEAIVHKIKLGGGTDEDCVIALANMVQELREKLIELESVSPKKVITKDGKTYVWHCPDHLIPASRTIEA